ncbi:MAG: 4Fe-4S binding protein [Spirochaetaceae bacterium]|jgi:NAD-dependent dihydropyrimidine dehydrogenase PreA subunit|nr:4Fe-4S binding protein [Spirochaetaceae bacterium]
MLQKIIEISQETCNGCGLCVDACKEGAVEIRNGKARLVREEYCDGLGSCLPVCPRGAISFIERDVLTAGSRSGQWPIQLKLIPAQATYFKDSHLLISADCSAYVRRDFYADFLQNKVLLIGCPKLDAVDYTEKITAILQNNTIASLTIVRMEVPCCTGLAGAAGAALKASGKNIPCKFVVLAVDGRVLHPSAPDR